MKMRRDEVELPVERLSHRAQGLAPARALLGRGRPGNVDADDLPLATSRRLAAADEHDSAGSFDKWRQTLGFPDPNRLFGFDEQRAGSEQSLALPEPRQKLEFNAR